MGRHYSKRQAALRLECRCGAATCCGVLSCDDCRRISQSSIICLSIIWRPRSKVNLLLILKFVVRILKEMVGCVGLVETEHAGAATFANDLERLLNFECIVQIEPLEAQPLEASPSMQPRQVVETCSHINLFVEKTDNLLASLEMVSYHLHCTVQTRSALGTSYCFRNQSCVDQVIRSGQFTLVCAQLCDWETIEGQTEANSQGELTNVTTKSRRLVKSLPQVLQTMHMR